MQANGIAIEGISVALYTSACGLLGAALVLGLVLGFMWQSNTDACVHILTYWSTGPSLVDRSTIDLQLSVYSLSCILSKGT